MEEKPKELYERYKTCMVRIETIDAQGDIHSGAGFHLGNGLIATAGHVVEYRLRQVVGEYLNENIAVRTIHRHSSESVDLAVLETNFDIDAALRLATYCLDGGVKQPAIERHKQSVPIGGHLDDWIGDELILSKVLLLGYPRIPFSREPVLAAVEGQVNAIIDRYNGPHPFFIVSCTARGGFSGGPAISEYGFLLGVVIGSFVHNGQELELGFNGVITIQPLLELLASRGLRPPEIDDEVWQLFQNS